MMILFIIASLCCYLLFSFKKDNRTQKRKSAELSEFEIFRMRRYYNGKSRHPLSAPKQV
ncbi:hypothetical protein [Bacillus sp. NPDC077027]|uniref:hypothetical protein n=1 Tax=Bacillus sp. NPDC077027 TaxID=3390548 RepID=UPI003D050E67